MDDSRSRLIRPRAGREDRSDQREPARPNRRARDYNVAPTTTITTVVRRHSNPQQPDDEATRRVRSMRWGLVPPWAKAGADGAPETKGPLLDQRPRREGHHLAGVSRQRQGQALPGTDGRLLRVAGQSRISTPGRKPARRRSSCTAPTVGCCSWRACGRSGETPRMHKVSTPLLSCTIITTDAVGELAEIHDRMPLIVRRAVTGIAGWIPTHRPTSASWPRRRASPASICGKSRRW